MNEINSQLILPSLVSGLALLIHAEINGKKVTPHYTCAAHSTLLIYHHTYRRAHSGQAISLRFSATSSEEQIVAHEAPVQQQGAVVVQLTKHSAHFTPRSLCQLICSLALKKKRVKENKEEIP